MDDSNVGLFQDASLRVIGHVRDAGESECFIFFFACRRLDVLHVQEAVLPSLIEAQKLKFLKSV